MRLITLCIGTLFSLASLAWAQTEPLHSLTDTPHETKSTLPSTSSLIAFAPKTDWRVVPSEQAPSHATAATARAMLKPAPLPLATLVQGRSDSIVGLEFSIGGVRPGGELRDTQLIRTAPVIGIGAGFRPPSAPPLQIDVGADFIIDAIGSPRQLEVFPGLLRDIDDVETLIYFGPRVYLTPRKSPLQFAVGGGGAFAYYKEFLESDENDFFRFRCFSCEGRSGFGFYGMAQLRYQISPIFGVGVTGKYYRVSTKGEAFSNTLSQSTKDDWLGLMLTFTFR